MVVIHETQQTLCPGPRTYHLSSTGHGPLLVAGAAITGEVRCLRLRRLRR